MSLTDKTTPGPFPSPKRYFLKVLIIGAAATAVFLSACSGGKTTPSGFGSNPPATLVPTPTRPLPGAPAALTFTTQPAGAVSGSAFTTPPTVTIEDSSGKPVPGSTALVTLSFAGDAGGAKLSGHTTVAAVNGVATFTDVSIDLAGTYYSLTAASPGLTSAVSNTFSVMPGAPVALDFVVQPVGGGAGQHFSTEPVVAIEDSHGNVVTDSKTTVTVEIQPGTGPKGAILSGGTTAIAANGLASFLDLSINIMGNKYVLIAKSPGLTSVISTAIAIVQPTTPPQ